MTRAGSAGPCHIYKPTVSIGRYRKYSAIHFAISKKIPIFALSYHYPNMKKSLSRLLTLAVLITVAACLSSCSKKKFSVTGTITEAMDSVLYFENMALDGPKKVDSLVLDANGSFSFTGEAPARPRPSVSVPPIPPWPPSIRSREAIIVPKSRSWPPCR